MADIDVPDFALKTVQIMAWAKKRCPDHGRTAPCFCATVAGLLKTKRVRRLPQHKPAVNDTPEPSHVLAPTPGVGKAAGDEVFVVEDGSV